ncbi:SixA phosphatase family protein [Streptomyces sp. PTD5-9]|uniref:SixA phosphatase family protein n=1 Tax=Streptomyces sp. PTD5-9 TaxID=3120150 RepID=UPI003FCEC6FD
MASGEAGASGAGAFEGERRLIVLRHAKSAWPEGVPDHERPLAGRGRRDAPAAGRRLYEAGYTPDLVVCSTARRTRETWDLAAAELLVRGAAAVPSEPVGALREAGVPEAVCPEVGRPAAAGPEVVFEPRVYEASAPALLGAVRDAVGPGAGAGALVARGGGGGGGEGRGGGGGEGRSRGRCRTVLLVGHQPGVQELVLSLAGGGDEEALARVRTKFPTSAFAVLALPGAWDGLVPGAAVLADFVVPRGPVPGR